MKLKILILLALFNVSLFALPSSWNVNYDNTGSSANIGLYTSGTFTVNGRALQNGDAVGAFFTDNSVLKCAGYFIWNGIDYGFPVWGDDGMTSGIKEGFAANESYSFKIWDNSLGTEHTATVTYSFGSSTYSDNGLSVLATATAGVAPTIPTVMTVVASSITQTTASAGGNITNHGGSLILSRGVVWSTSINPTIALTTKTDDGMGTSWFTSSITGLSENTTYYYKAYATNSVGTAYGTEQNFTTLMAPPLAPILSSPTNNAINIGIYPSLSWNSSTNATNYRVQVSTDSSFSTYFSNSIETLTSKTLSGLAINTKYYWRVNSMNTNDTSSFSSIWSFTTVQTAPVKEVNIKLALQGLWSGTKHVITGVKIELRQDSLGTSLKNSVLKKYRIAELDASMNAKADFSDLPDGNYYLIVRAAGYLPLATISKLSLSSSGINYDFTTSSSQFAGGVSTGVLHNSGVWMARFGDGNNSRAIDGGDLTTFSTNNGKGNSALVP